MKSTALQGIKVMSPGPTQISESVLNTLAVEYTNPDMDPSFVTYYKETAKQFNQMIQNDGETFILTGEGILGLEAACASFIETGDTVLTISNGIFGKGFDQFSKMYGGNTTLFESDSQKGIDIGSLEAFIKEKGPFKLATFVHCETPSGITNAAKDIGKLLQKYDILSIVDSVSAIGGEPMNMTDWGLDVVLCASQKVISAPVGLSTVSLSQKALGILRERKTPIIGFYNNLKIWLDYEEKQWFPYTQPIHLIVAFKKALEQIDIQTSLEVHRQMAHAIRNSFWAAGFSLYAVDSYANTVTTVCLPEGLAFSTLNDRLMNIHRTLIGGGFDFLENKIFRVGHMGTNANYKDLHKLMQALDECFEAFAVPVKASLAGTFERAFKADAV